MAPYFQRHRPLIAARIEFLVEPLPSIRSRIEFTPERLVDKRQVPHETIGDDANTQTEPVHVQLCVAEPSTRIPTLRRQPPPLKIPKPSGEPGRPLSGGYCLSSVLVNTHKWSEKSVEELTDAVRSEARKRLNITSSFRSQNLDAINLICEKMMHESKWPVLRDYEECWPVRSILKMTLKYSAEQSRRVRDKEAAKRVREALQGSGHGSGL